MPIAISNHESTLSNSAQNLNRLDFSFGKYCQDLLIDKNKKYFTQTSGDTPLTTPRVLTYFSRHLF
jgi:hypothetical protein